MTDFPSKRIPNEKVNRIHGIDKGYASRTRKMMEVSNENNPNKVPKKERENKYKPRGGRV